MSCRESRERRAQPSPPRPPASMSRPDQDRDPTQDGSDARHLQPWRSMCESRRSPSAPAPTLGDVDMAVGKAVQPLRYLRARDVPSVRLGTACWFALCTDSKRSTGVTWRPSPARRKDEPPRRGETPVAGWRHIVTKTVQFAALMLFSLVTGVFWGTWFSLSRSMAEITPGTFLEVGHLMIANLGGPMSVLMPAALLSALVLCVLLVRRRQPAASLFAAAALMLMVVALVITLVVNVPIDRQIQSWTTAALAPDWQAIRDRWEFYHGLRTLVSVVALVCLFASTLATAWRIAPERQAQRGEYPGTSRSTAA